MPTVINGSAVKAVMGAVIGWEYELLHWSVPNDDGRLVSPLLIRLLKLTQNLKIREPCVREPGSARELPLSVLLNRLYNLCEDVVHVLVNGHNYCFVRQWRFQRRKLTMQHLRFHIMILASRQALPNKIKITL